MKFTDFDIYKDLLQAQSGLELSPDDNYLLESRLTPISKKWGYANLLEMTIALNGVPDPVLVNEIVEAMTVNDTAFFRDFVPFDVFKDTLIGKLKETRQGEKRIRVWCAAAASGQEPYSLAIIIKELMADYAGWRFDIIATDISSETLEQAREGLYSQAEVQRGMPTSLLLKHFTQEDDKWQLHADIQKMVTFQRFNLLDPMTELGAFDVIFCRNVLCDFDDKTRTKVLENIAKQMPDDGYLILGKDENVTGLTECLESMSDTHGIFVPKSP